MLGWRGGVGAPCNQLRRAKKAGTTGASPCASVARGACVLRVLTAVVERPMATAASAASACKDTHNNNNGAIVRRGRRRACVLWARTAVVERHMATASYASATFACKDTQGKMKRAGPYKMGARVAWVQGGMFTNEPLEPRCCCCTMISYVSSRRLGCRSCTERKRNKTESGREERIAPSQVMRRIMFVVQGTHHQVRSKVGRRPCDIRH